MENHIDQHNHHDQNTNVIDHHIVDCDQQNVVYRECLRNHAASLGSYATDGCGEFTLSSPASAAAATATALQCAACGCHRNFHRKVVIKPPAMKFHFRHHDHDHHDGDQTVMMMMSKSKRVRTKFTADQKQKMLAFAERLRWRLQQRTKDDAAAVSDDEIESFCRGVGVSRQVFKVWMHNHKSLSSFSANSSVSTSTTGNASSLTQ